LILDRKSPKPLHSQLEEILRGQIEYGYLSVNQMIPSENELSKRFNLSRMTVRNAIVRLVSDGLLYRVPGKGTFVAPAKITTVPLTQMGIREQLVAMGYETGTMVVEKRIEKVSGKVADYLQLPENDPVYVLVRLRYANNEPLSLHTSYIPVKNFAELFQKNLEKEPLCDIFDKHYGIIAKRGVETLESVGTDSRESKLLTVKKGFHVLLLKYTLYSQNDIPFEYAKVLFRGDRIKLRFEFYR